MRKIPSMSDQTARIWTQRDFYLCDYIIYDNVYSAVIMTAGHCESSLAIQSSLHDVCNALYCIGNACLLADVGVRELLPICDHI